ncbi:retinol dehydrogenase 13 isoform X3 [Salminus brasiliensis]|uniref:retinol dehydrogenase 13 isoform X3 n=1 Tax=Salminus brasiliensis TaxID=930266 RepID=UPI003B834E92
MNLYISAAQLWEELKSNHLAKYGAVTAATAITGLVLLRKWIAGGVCHSHVRLDGKTVLITGANTGIGKETARDMAKRGVMMCPHSLTEDGYETQFAVNHLGHFLLTVLLLDMLKNSTPSRIINVSSIAHKGGKIHFDDLSFNRTPYDSLVSYRQSKLANVLFTRELSRRTKGSGVTAYALHPGVIRTELGRYVEMRHPVVSTLLSIPALLLMKTPKQGAQTTIYCAITEGLENHSGCYFSDCRLMEPALEAKDDLAAMRLWDVSAKLVGYKEED